MLSGARILQDEHVQCRSAGTAWLNDGPSSIGANGGLRDNGPGSTAACPGLADGYPLVWFRAMHILLVHINIYICVYLYIIHGLPLKLPFDLYVQDKMAFLSYTSSYQTGAKVPGIGKQR